MSGFREIDLDQPVTLRERIPCEVCEGFGAIDKLDHLVTCKICYGAGYKWKLESITPLSLKGLPELELEDEVK